MTEELLSNKLKDTRAKLAEIFEDYLVVVPFGTGVWFITSDRTWALGACARVDGAIREQDAVIRGEGREVEDDP